MPYRGRKSAQGQLAGKFEAFEDNLPYDSVWLNDALFADDFSAWVFAGNDRVGRTL